MSTTHQLSSRLLLTVSAAGGGWIRAELRTYQDGVVISCSERTALEAVTAVLRGLLDVQSDLVTVLSEMWAEKQQPEPADQLIDHNGGHSL